MRFLKMLPTILSVVLLCSVVAISNNVNNKPDTSEKIMTVSNNYTEEMKGIWVTYMELDMQSTDKSYDTFKSKFKKIANTSKDKGFNSLIVQVRPFCDALYKSSYFPYSHILTGEQGKNPNYDPLKFMCKYTHKLGMKIHAWVNPYRIKTTSTPSVLHKSNPYMKNKNLGVKTDTGIYFNPALQEVREIIESGIKEIVENYDVDGIQFDDYFYPTQDESFDKKEYTAYTKTVGAGKALSLSQWRIANVNLLIAEVYNIIHSTKDKVQFGISPQGNIDNDYNMYADVKNWCKKYGYIDYICPQLYYSIKSPILSFPDALNQWTQLKYNNNVKLYIGIAGYKIGTNDDEGTWNLSDKILKNEVELLRKKGASGVIFYSYSNLNSKVTAKEINNLTKVLV